MYYKPRVLCLMQELKFHGRDSLCGLSGSLSMTGNSGKHPQNIKRDTIRALRKRQLNTDASRQNIPALNHFSKIETLYVDLINCTPTPEAPIQQVQVPLKEFDEEGNCVVCERRAVCFQ